MPTRLLLIRHGATKANLEHPPILQGRKLDLELSEEGMRQVEALADFLAAEPLAAVYASPLRRAHQTAAAVARRHRLDVATLPDVTECDIGDWEGFSWPAIEQRWPEAFTNFQRDAGRHGYLGGENLQQVCDRAAPPLAAMAEKHPRSTIAVVSHNVVNRVILAHWLGIPIAWARRLPQENTGINRILLGDGVQVVTVNEVIHLSDRKGVK